MPIRVRRPDGSVEPGLVYLKVKVKSLAEEARIIRREENKPGAPRHGLAEHRRTVVRRAARHAQLAYGFMRGRSYRQLEAHTHERPIWGLVHTMVEKYGPTWAGCETRAQYQDRRKTFMEDFDKWRK